VPRQVEGKGTPAGCEGDLREIAVVLLPGVRAMDDHDAGRLTIAREPQPVGEPVVSVLPFGWTGRGALHCGGFCPFPSEWALP
jgi:hypothetical protein